MHPDVTAAEPETCPKCGMKLVAAAPAVSSYTCPMHPDVTAAEPGTCPQCGMKLVASDGPPAPELDSLGGHGHGHGDGLEWEDLMPEINRASDPSNMIWQLIDRETGAENGAISWAFTVGDRVKIRLVNEMDSDHPMHHPFHIHGAGRFLILSRDGEPESNLVWKDTVLVRAGQTVDILLDVCNPGLWMAHCHIAEHTESGMMFSFNVARDRSRSDEPRDERPAPGRPRDRGWPGRPGHGLPAGPAGATLRDRGRRHRDRPRVALTLGFAATVHLRHATTTCRACPSRLPRTPTRARTTSRPTSRRTPPSSSCRCG